MQAKHYPYVGPHDLKALAATPTERSHVVNPAVVQRWVTTTQSPNRDHTYVATFVIDTAAQLWIADQHSEHVACARGGAVLAAGEMTFVVGDQIRVSNITNQSTGYCPEPASWPSVERVLDQVGLDHPTTWTSSYEFRRCTTCGMTNIIKDNWFECGVCDHPLSPVWNFDAVPNDDCSG